MRRQSESFQDGANAGWENDSSDRHIEKVRIFKRKLLINIAPNTIIKRVMVGLIITAASIAAFVVIGSTLVLHLLTRTPRHTVQEVKGFHLKRTCFSLAIAMEDSMETAKHI